MTYNEKKRFLESYINSMRRIRGLQNELEEWVTTATNITQKLKPVMVQNGFSSSKIENSAIKIAELEDEIDKEIELAMQKRDMVKETISKIRDTRRREIVEMRYVNCMSVRKISREIGKDNTNVYKMLQRAIKTLDI